MISATSPMFTVFFARWFIKEPILKVNLINFVIVFIGIILIVKPPFIFGWTDMYTSNPQAKWAVLGTVLSCVFLQSNVLVVLRQLKSVHWSLPIATLGTIGFFITLIPVIVLGSLCLPDNLIDRFYTVLTGFTEFGGQISMVLVAKYENAATGSLLSMAFHIIVTFLGQFIFLQVCMKLFKHLYDIWTSHI